MRTKPGLIRRDGTYYVRVRVPTLAAATLQKCEIKVSLRTKDLKEANLRYIGAIQRIYDEISKATQGGPPPVTRRTVPIIQLQRMALEWLAPRWRAEQLELWKPHKTFGTEDCPIYLLHRELNTLQSSEEPVYGGFLALAEELLVAAAFGDADCQSIETLASFLRRGEIAVADACLRHYNGDTGHELRDPVFASLNGPMSAEPAARGFDEHVSDRATAPTPITINQAIDRFFADPRRAQLSARNSAGYATGFKLLREVVGGGAPLNAVTLEHATAVQVLLSRMPANATKKFPGLSAEQAALAASQRGIEPLEAKTASNILSRLAAFFRWAVGQELIPRPRFHDLKPLQERKRKGDSRRAFSADELATLFSGDVHRRPVLALDHREPSQYWVPLLALYHGCRLNEICQLETSDVRMVDEIPCLSLSEDGVNGRTKRLKTRNAERTIPLHPFIVKLGFLDYCDAVRAANSTQLFPDLRPSVAGSLSHRFSQWFGRFCDRRGISDERLSFHSFRHTFADACRAVDIPQPVYARLGGWSTDKSESESYGTGYAPKRMADEIAKIGYPSVEALVLPLQVVNERNNEISNIPLIPTQEKRFASGK